MRTVITILFLLVLCFAGLGQVNDSSATSSTVKDITPEQLKTLLDLPTLHVIDVNEEDNYNEAHVPGAQRLEYDAITVAALHCDRKDALVFYCWSVECPAAETAAEMATTLGFTEVYCMHAGITGWQDAGFPTAP